MFFSSLIAENASRKIRLVFPSPSHVPAPVKEDSGAKTDPIAMFDLIRFPTWMENKEDPFSAHLIRPVLSTSSLNTDSTTSTSSSSSSGSIAHLEDRRGSITPATEAIPPSEDSNISGTRAGSEDKADVHGDDKQFNPMMTATSPSPSSKNASTERQVVPRSRYKHFSLPANFRFFPITTILLAGGNAMPLLSALTNLPDTPHRLLAHRRPRTSVYDDRTLAISESPSVHENSTENATTGRCDLNIFSGLSELHIPQSPFDPFGSIGVTSPYLKSIDKNAGSSYEQENEEGNNREYSDMINYSTGTTPEANLTTDGESHVGAAIKTVNNDQCADEEGKEESNSEHKRPRLEVSSAIRGNAIGLDALALCPSHTFPSKSPGPSAEIRTASHHISLIDLRPQPLRRLEHVPRETRDDDLTTPIDIPTRASGDLANVNGSSNAMHTHAARHTQGERFPVATLKYATPVTVCDSSAALSSEDSSEPEGGAAVKGKSSSTKRFRKSVMGKIKKLAHVKSSLSK